MIISTRAEERIAMKSWVRLQKAARFHLMDQLAKRRRIIACECPNCNKLIAVCTCERVEKDRLHDYLNRMLDLFGAQRGVSMATEIQLEQLEGK